MENLLAGLTAAFLTLFDLDRTFYIPSRTPSKVRLYAWWWGFVLLNGILAAGLYGIVVSTQVLQGVNGWIGALIVGAGYLAVVRIKFVTVNLQGRNVAFGLEALYEAAKEFVYKRINSIARDARLTETRELADSKTLEELGERAKMNVDGDALLGQEQKYSDKEWILRVLRDPNSTDFDKRAVLANYILSGQRSIHIS